MPNFVGYFKMWIFEPVRRHMLAIPPQGWGGESQAQEQPEIRTASKWYTIVSQLLMSIYHIIKWISTTVSDWITHIRIVQNKLVVFHYLQRWCELLHVQPYISYLSLTI